MIDPTFFGITGSPDAMGAEEGLNDLIERLRMAQAQPQGPISIPAAGIAVQNAPGRSQGPQISASPVQRAPRAAQGTTATPTSVDSPYLDGGPTSTPTKRQDRLPSAGGETVIPRQPAAAARGNQAGPTPRPDFGPSIGERISNFGDALTGRSYVNFADQARQRNATYDALRRMGYDDQMARAAVLNPSLLSGILKSRLGATPAIREVDTGREKILVDERNNRIIRRFPVDEATIEGEKTLAREQAKRQAKTPEAFRVGKQKLKNLNTQNATVTQDIEKAISMISDQGAVPETGIIGGARSLLPFTDAGTLSQLLDTIRANIGFDKLQAMRDASPTGGALGQVSEFENRLLQATSGSLNQWGKGEFLKRNLERILKNWKGLNEAYNEEFRQQFSIPEGAKQGKDGNFYIPDPDRPGGYLQYRPETQR